ncbi:MAG: hypothetical protein J5808_06200, partial [Paludibacteraceae bacterium]|nr:hypothetical protein [Paludibacteraceae bacterium]
MALLKRFFTCIILLWLTSCEFNPVRFVWTETDVNVRFEQSRAYSAKNPSINLSFTDAYQCAAVSDAHLSDDDSYVRDLYTRMQHDNIGFVVYNGDLYNGKPEYADFARQLLINEAVVPSYFVC